MVTAQGGKAPQLASGSDTTLVPVNRQPLLAADKDSGTSTWVYRFGDGENYQEGVGLALPTMSNPKTGGYWTTLIWELSSVPENQ